MSLEQKLAKLWGENDVFNREEILVPVQWRVLRRCDYRENGKRCVQPAIWRVRGYYDGRLEFVRYFCPRHLIAWDESLAEDERRGVLSWAWRYDVKRIASKRAIRRWTRMALIQHGL
jgi:hypothetical protein